MKKVGRRCAARRRRRKAKTAMIAYVFALVAASASFHEPIREIEDQRPVLNESQLATMEIESDLSPGNGTFWAEKYPEYADHFLNPRKYIEARRRAAEMEEQENELAG